MAMPEPNERGSDCETLESSSNHEDRSNEEAKDCKGRESQRHDETYTEEKLEDKFAQKQVESEGITSKYKVVNCMDKKTGRGTQISSR